MAEAEKAPETDSKEASKDDFQVALMANQEMETKMSSMPLVLSIIANLNLIAAGGADFPLLPEERTDDVLRNPDSFRASVAQVSLRVFAIIKF